MAKRKKAKVRTVVRYRKARRPKRKQEKMGFLKGFIEPLSSVGYGFLRDKISDAVARTDIAKKLPASQFTDEMVMYGLAWGGGKMGLNKVPIARSLVKVAKTVELARIGATMSDMQQAKTTTSNGVVANNQMIVIG